MTRKGAANKPAYKRYLGGIVGLAIAIPIGIGLVYLATDHEEFFFEDFACNELLYLEMTQDNYDYVTDAQKQRVAELIEEKECDDWTIQN